MTYHFKFKTKINHRFGEVILKVSLKQKYNFELSCIIASKYSREQDRKAFFMGARQTGKSMLLKHLFPDSLWFDLLQSDVFERLHKQPSQLREIVLATQPGRLVVVDEIQMIPALLHKVHWLI